MSSADPIDAASEQEQKFLELAIYKNSIHIKRKPKKLGSCDYCGEKTKNLFCSAECRDEDHNEVRLRALDGRY